MDKEAVVSLIKGEKFTELSDTLKDVPFGEIDKLIDSRALRNKGDTVVLIRGLLHGSSPNTTHTCERRLHIFQHCINLLQGSNLGSKLASELVGVLMMETDGFPARSLAELASLYTDAIKSGIGTNEKSLELFPKILSAISAQEAVVFAGKDMSGPDYKSHILNSLCSGRWDTRTVIHLAAMFKDVPMTQDELQFVIEKLLRLLGELDLQGLPPLIYQLLLLASKGHKKLVLDGVISFFEQKDRQCKEQNSRQNDELSEMVDDSTQVRFVEGTIILHITFAMKQDQDLGREFIKCLKASQQCSASKIMAPFNLALSLSTARIHRFEEQVYDILKGTILKSYKELEKQKQSRFVKDMTPDSVDLVEYMQDTITNSKSGWDHVTQGLVQLGFTLMDSYGPKGVFGRIPEGLPTSQKTPTQKACDLGARILLQTFKAHEMVRGEILEQILNRVVTKATAPVSHIMELLSNTVKTAPQSLMDCLPKVREALDYLSYLPPLTGNALLKAIHPLLKISMNLKDSLVLVLRKAMFSKQLEARKIAVSGFLLILQNFKVLGGMPSSQSASQSFASSSSQPDVSVDIHIPYNTATNEALCLEILGNLRRCLQQQADVRHTLYEGLYDVLCKNTQLGLPMLGMLTLQFMKCYENVEDINPPVKLEPCITAQGDQVFLNEPLAHLLSCMVQCLMKTNEIRSEQRGEDEDDDTHQQTQKILESLTRRMVRCEMEDFELDKSADFSLATSVGRKNSMFLCLVMGIYEVLIEYNFCTANFDAATIQQVLSLFKIYQKLADIAKEKSAGSAGAAGNGGKDKKSKGRSAASANASSAKNAPKSLMTIKCVTQLLKAIFSDEIPRHQEGVKQMRENVDFVRYIVTVALQKIQQISDRGTCDGAEGHDQKRIFTYISQLARIMLQTYATNLELGDDNLPGRARHIYPLCLEGFAAVTSTICNRYPQNLSDYIKAIDYTGQVNVGSSSLSKEDLLHKQIKRFQRIIMNVITSKDDDRSPKEALPFLNVISQLCANLEPGGQQITQVHTWIQKVCLEHAVDDVSVVRSLLSLLFTLTVQEKSVLVLLSEMARDIHFHLGDIDQGVELQEDTKFAVVTVRNAAPTILLPVMAQMDRELEDTEWILNKLKAESNLSSNAETLSPGPTQQETQGKILITRLGHMVNAFHELSQSVLPVGTCIDTVVKVLTRLYGTLGMITKYYISLYTQKSGHIPPRFEKLVKLTGTHLTQYVYAMITYVQASQNEHLVAANEKTKDKDKKITTAVALAAKAKVMKEGRAIPSLIFGIEQYEKFLITLSRKSKVNLMEHMKHSTSRDFRIDAASLQSALQEQASSDEEMEVGETTTNDTTTNEPNETKNGGPTNNQGNENGADSGSSSSEEEQENVAPPAKKAKLSTTASSDSDTKTSKVNGSKGKVKKSKTLSARDEND